MRDAYRRASMPVLIGTALMRAADPGPLIAGPRGHTPKVVIAQR
jgi:hypothetical protein